MVGFVQSPYILLNVGVPYFAISSSIPLTLLYGILSASIKTASRKSFNVCIIQSFLTDCNLTLFSSHFEYLEPENCCLFKHFLIIYIFIFISIVFHYTIQPCFLCLLFRYN